MSTSTAEESQAASILIDQKIAKLGDRRATTLSRMRALIHEALPNVVEDQMDGDAGVVA